MELPFVYLHTVTKKGKKRTHTLLLFGAWFGVLEEIFVALTRVGHLGSVLLGNDKIGSDVPRGQVDLTPFNHQ